MTLTVAGWYRLKISVGGRVVDAPHGDFLLLALPGEPTAQQSCVVNAIELQDAKIGATDLVELTVELRDSFGNACWEGGALLTATVGDLLRPVQASVQRDGKLAVQDKCDGSYRVSFTPNGARCAVSGQLHVNLTLPNGDHVAGSPVSLQVIAGKPHASHSIASGDGLEGALAGKRAEFRVHLRDGAGNSVGIGGYKVHVQITPTLVKQGHEVDVKDLDNGEFRCRYVIPLTGRYSIAVLLGDSTDRKPIKGSPFSILVDRAT